MRSTEQIINNVNGSLAIEGLPLTEEDKKRCRQILSGKISVDEVIRQLTEKYMSIGKTYE